MIYKFSGVKWLFTASVVFLLSCSKDRHNDNVHNPDSAEEASIDRFSATVGHLMVRTSTNGLPAPNEAVNFDQGPFITKGLGPAGQTIEYYNFDVQPTMPAPIYVFFKQGQTNPVSGQLNVVNVIPGDFGYNDFWQVYKVTVPDNYVANTIGSLEELNASGYQVERTNALVNCPVVPKGSVATKRFIPENAGLFKGWYKGKIVYYFNFGERAITATAGGMVPVEPIYVTFNINPGQPGGGPDSGFKTETGSTKTHNVAPVLPTDASYSPLWRVVVYDNAKFDMVSNYSTVANAPVLVPDAGEVNCPIVSLQ